MNDIRVIMLGGKRGGFTLLDLDDFEDYKDKPLHPKQDRGGSFYVCTHIKKDGVWSKELLHRLLLPGVRIVDHKNGYRFDNRKSNLRPGLKGNPWNRRPNKKAVSKFKGVSWHRHNQVWTSGIQVEGERIHLGCFKSEVEAARAYDKAAKRYFGEFAFLNFPELKEAA